MQVRLAEGVWARFTAERLHLGRLTGDLGHGWSTAYAHVSARALPALIRRLNLGGLWTDGRTTVSVAAGSARIEFDSAVVAVLTVEQTARLQVACSVFRCRPPGQSHEDRAGLPGSALTGVRTSRGRLRLPGTMVGSPTGPGRVVADDGVVRVQVDTTAGRLEVVLPALEMLVAASEAGRDRRAVTVEVTGPDTDPVSIELPADASVQAAAEAQWLLPGFTRPPWVNRR